MNKQYTVYEHKDVKFIAITSKGITTKWVYKEESIKNLIQEGYTRVPDLLKIRN